LLPTGGWTGVRRAPWALSDDTHMHVRWDWHDAFTPEVSVP
jgi:hypothetical protein